MSKLAKGMITSLIVLLLAGGGALAVVLYMSDESSEGSAQSIDGVLEHSYETPEITTDLQNGSFVRIQFRIVTNSENAREEAKKREFQLKNILIKELAKMDEKDFKSGLSDLEDMVRLKLNEIMTEGNITDVYTTSKILQ